MSGMCVSGIVHAVQTEDMSEVCEDDCDIPPPDSISQSPSLEQSDSKRQKTPRIRH